MEVGSRASIILIEVIFRLSLAYFRYSLQRGKTMRKRPELEIIVLTSSTVLVVAVLAAYMINFFHLGISSQTLEWSQFGTYLGGTTTPILSFVTMLFVLLSYRHARETSNALDVEKSVRIYFELAARIEEKVDEKYGQVRMHLPPYNNITAQNNPKSGGSHPALWELSDLFSQLITFTRRISRIDSNSPIIGYYENKYNEPLEKLVAQGYIDGSNARIS
jgi:hypothetical protein